MRVILAESMVIVVLQRWSNVSQWTRSNFKYKNNTSSLDLGKMIKEKNLATSKI